MNSSQNLVGSSELETLKMELKWSADYGRELLRNLKVLYTALSHGVAYFAPTKTDHDLDSNQCKYNALIAMMRGLMMNLENSFEFQMIFKPNDQIKWQSIDTGLYTLQRQGNNEIPVPMNKTEHRIVQPNDTISKKDRNAVDKAIGKIIDSSAAVQDIMTKWFSTGGEQPTFRVNIEAVDKDGKSIALSGLDISGLVAKHAKRVLESYDEENHRHCHNDHECDCDGECNCGEDHEHCECECEEE